MNTLCKLGLCFALLNATELTDTEWQFNAVFYPLRADSAWHLRPHDQSPWRTMDKQFEAWREDGIWERLLTGLRRQLRQLTREA